MFWILLLSTVSICIAQHIDSSRTRISLLTCTPGEELYAVFGHSALRIIDSNAVTDIVFNYGTFDFSDPDFYSKFVRGKLNYYLSAEHFNEFVYSYQLEGRGITEQVLDLNQTEKETIKKLLRENLRAENRFYAYDFFLDNCTTRLRDLILKTKSSKHSLPYVMPEDYSFRNAIHAYLNAQKKDWSKLGIDLLLGAPTDATMSASQQQFLPDNLMFALDSSSPAIVYEKKSVYSPNIVTTGGFRFTPFLIFSFFGLLVVLMGLMKHRVSQKILQGLDFLLFFITGLLGILFVLMWFATEHTMTKENYNLLWALPTHAVMAFFLGNTSQAVRKYFFVSAIMNSICLLGWAFLPQQLNISLLPIVILLAYRSFVHYKKQ